MDKKKKDKTAPARSRRARAKLKASGILLKQIRVHCDDWPSVRELLDRLAQARRAD